MIGDAAFDNHIENMQLALQLAEQALNAGEFPVGCIMVHDGRVIAAGRRQGTARGVPSELDHAEIIALRQLESVAHPVNRADITLYATMEPCLMCFGAICICGIGTIVYAYEDAMGGGTACNRQQMPELYRDNSIQLVGGVCREESLKLFKRFFENPELNYWRDSYLARYTLSQA